MSGDIVTVELEEFFEYFWRDTEGWVYLPVQPEPYGPTDWRKFVFQWPRQRAGVIRHVLKHNALRSNVFFSPALYRVGRPTREEVIGTWALWADFDGNAPDWSAVEDVPRPTLIVQSSLPGKEHCYWRLDEFATDISWIEDRNRAIAYALKADTSGWDADQVLRPIHTTNYKHDLPVHVKEWER